MVQEAKEKEKEKKTVRMSTLNVWFLDWRHYVFCEVGNEL
jgi:hypothetical protein